MEAEAGEFELIDHGLYLADIYDPNTGPFSLRPPTFGAPPTSGKTKLRAIDFMHLCIEKKECGTLWVPSFYVVFSCFLLFFSILFIFSL